MMSEKQIKADLKKEGKSFLKLYAIGVIHWQALDRIRLLRKVLGQKALTKAEKVYGAWGKEVAASYERRRQNEISN